MNIPWRHAVVVGSAALLLLAHVLAGFWKEPAAILRSDAANYYVYLPAGIVYRDWSLGFLERIPEAAGREVARIRLENGQLAIKMSLGLAVLHAPFFLLGHAVAAASDAWPADGYSRPYAAAVVCGAIFYFALGLHLLGRVLAARFGERAAALTLALLAWGTNATYYLLREPAMSHGYSFCLFAAFVALTAAWHRRPGRVRALALGLVYGLVTLVRPTNGVVALVFLLWDVGGWADVKSKVVLLAGRMAELLLIPAAALLVWVPQFLYWHQVTGHWLHYSYVDEGFFFLRPRLLEVVAGFRKGWLVYTPAMVFALLGLGPLFRRHRGIFWAVLVFLLANLYVVSSWWCWWYGGSHGQRALIESYAVMALPLAALIAWSFERGRAGAVAVLAVSALLVLHNGFQLAQMKTGALHMENMTRSAYFRSFGRLQPTPQYQAALRPPDFAAARRGLPESEWSARP